MKDTRKKMVDTRSKSFSFKEMVKNVPSSAVDFGTNIGMALTHPAQAGMGLIRTAAGGLGSLAEKAAPGAKEALTTPEDQQAWDSFKEMLSQRYGDVNSLKQTVESDPVGFASDVSAVFGGVGGMIGKAGKVSGISELSSVGQGLSTAGKLTNPVNVARGTARLAGEYIAKPIAKGMEGLSGISKNQPGSLEAEFNDPSIMFAKGTKSASTMYDKKKANPVNPDYENIASEKDFVAKALEDAQNGNLNPEGALAAKQTLRGIRNSLNDLYFRKALDTFKAIADPVFGEADEAFMRGKQSEAMRNLLPINKGGDASVGRLVIGGGTAALAHNPLAALAFSPAAQGIAAGSLGLASNLASPVAKALIDRPELGAVFGKKLGLAGYLK